MHSGLQFPVNGKNVTILDAQVTADGKTIEVTWKAESDADSAAVDEAELKKNLIKNAEVNIKAEQISLKNQKAKPVTP
jgi:DNA-binding protein